MRVLVCGGRDYGDRARVYRMLHQLAADFDGIDCVIHGAATGADSLAGEWARAQKIEEKRYPAKWLEHTTRCRPDCPRKKHGEAGPIRNQEMLDKEHPELVVAFPGGHGTADMVSRAERACVPVLRVQPSGPLPAPPPPASP